MSHATRVSVLIVPVLVVVALAWPSPTQATPSTIDCAVNVARNDFGLFAITEVYSRVSTSTQADFICSRKLSEAGFREKDVLPVSAFDRAYIADRSAFSLPFEVTAGEPPQEGPTHGLLFYFEHLSVPSANTHNPPPTSPAGVYFKASDCAVNLSSTDSQSEMIDNIFSTQTPGLSYTIDSAYHLLHSNKINNAWCLAHVEYDFEGIDDVRFIFAPSLVISDMDAVKRKRKKVIYNELKNISVRFDTISRGFDGRKFTSDLVVIGPANTPHPGYASLPDVDTVPCALNILYTKPWWERENISRVGHGNYFLVYTVYHRFENNPTSDVSCLNYIESADIFGSGDVAANTIYALAGRPDNLPPSTADALKTMLANGQTLFSVPFTVISYADFDGEQKQRVHLYFEHANLPNASGQDTTSKKTPLPMLTSRDKPHCSVNIYRNEAGEDIVDSAYGRVYGRFGGSVTDDTECLKQLVAAGGELGQPLGDALFNPPFRTNFSFSIPIFPYEYDHKTNDERTVSVKEYSFAPELVAGPVNFGRATNQTGDQTEPSPTKTTTETNSVTATNDEELRSLLLQLLQLLQAR